MSDDAHTQAVVVAVLARLGAASVAAIAHEARIDEGTARRALRVLERAGLASRPRSHGPWSLTGKPPVAAATRPETHKRGPDLVRVATDDDRAPTGKKPIPWWHGNPSTRSWWERKRLRDRQLRESVKKLNEKCAKNEQ
jgi:hypothetical protein